MSSPKKNKFGNIYDDPKFGPMMRRLDALDLPSAYAPTNPDAPAEELSGAGLVSTGGHNNARATVSADAAPKGAPKGTVGGAKVQMPDTADADNDDEADVLVALPEGDRGQRTRVMPAVIQSERRRQRWKTLILLALVLVVIVAMAAYFRPDRSPRGDDGASELDVAPKPKPKPTGYAPIGPMNADVVPTLTAPDADTTATPSGLPRPSARPRASAWAAPTAGGSGLVADGATPDDVTAAAAASASASASALVVEPPTAVPDKPAPKPSTTVDLFHQ